MRVFFFSSFSLFFFSLLLLSCHKIISPLSRLKKKKIKNLLFFRPQNTHFFFFSLSLSLPRGQITTTQRERNVRHFLSHKTRRYTHTHTHTSMSSTPNVPSPPPSDPFAPNPPPVPGILITKVRFLNRFLKRERKRERETNNRNVLSREDHLSPAG